MDRDLTTLCPECQHSIALNQRWKQCPSCSIFLRLAGDASQSVEIGELDGDLIRVKKVLPLPAISPAAGRFSDRTLGLAALLVMSVLFIGGALLLNTCQGSASGLPPLTPTFLPGF